VALTFDPFRDLDRMASQMLASSLAPTRSARWMPMDLYRSGDHYVVNVDLPGVDPGSIDLQVDGNTLTIRAERTISAEESVQWLAQERPGGTYMRQLSLGDGLDVDKIHADYHHGVLCLTIPVAEQARPRKIEVRTRSKAQGEVQAQEAIKGEVASGPTG
jgi:HSP20 family protein